MFSDMSQVGAKGAHLFFLLSLTILVTLMLAGSIPSRAAMLPATSPSKKLSMSTLGSLIS